MAEIKVKLAQTHQGIGGISIEQENQGVGVNITDGKISEVVHDETLKGNGRLSNPLGIADSVLEDIDSRVEKTSQADKVYGTDENGDQTLYSADSFGKVDDVLVNGESVVENKVANITVGDATITIQKNGTAVDSFTTNATQNKSINITVPTTAADVHALPDTTTINDLTTQEQQDALNSGITSSGVAQITLNENNITTINSKIPEQASSSNKLADKNFVNSSISTNTANFIGTFNSVEELEEYSGTVTNNDYAFVISTDSQGNTVYNRYKYTTATTPASWQFEYALNNSSFTSDQWAAINSGATTTNIGQIATNTSTISGHIADKNNPHQVTKAQVGLGNVDNTSDLNKPISTAVQNALNAKQNTLTAGTDLEIVSSSGLPAGYIQLDYIESTGTQGIDTEYTVTSANTKVEIISLSENYSSKTLYGWNKQSSDSEWMVLYNNTMYLGSGNTGSIGLTNGIKNTLIFETDDSGNYNYSINGTTRTGTYSGTFWADPTHVYVLCQNIGAGLTRQISAKLYSFKLWDDGVLVRDLVPALDTNNIPCMYDRVGSRPYYNQGTGNFIAGNEVPADSIINFTNASGYALESYVDSGLATKQDILTAGTNITIENNVISSTAQESFYRGRFDDFNDVPSSASSYMPKPGTTDEKTPENNDFIVITDASDYIEPGDLTSKITASAQPNYTVRIVDESGVTHNYYYDDGFNYTWKAISDNYSLLYQPGVPGHWWIKTNIAGDTKIFIGGVEYTVDPQGTTIFAGAELLTTSTEGEIEVGLPPSSGKYKGTWRFYYNGVWATDGKLGWNPQYQIENTLPIADSQTLGIAKLYTTTGNNTDGSMTQDSITTQLATKQNTLTAGTNISITSDVISSMAQESFYRGSFATWNSVPTNNDVNDYDIDTHGSHIPQKTDYIVIFDPSTYVSQEEPVLNIDTTSTSSVAAAVKLTLVSSGYEQNYVYNDVANNWVRFSDSDFYISYNGAGASGWGIKNDTSPFVVNSVRYEPGEVYSWTYSTEKHDVVNSYYIYKGTWRFVYDGIWGTDGKNGWKPQYQVEKLLPDATSSEKGIAKLYTSTGNNTDGSMTQKSVSDALNLKANLTDVNNATLTIQKNGTSVATFTANSSTDITANITVPTDTNDLTNGAGYQTSSDVSSAISTHNTSTTAHSNIITPITNDITAIEEKIPAQASSSNQLADKNFVNSSIATNTANFIGTFNSIADLEAYSGTLTNNDYAFVVGTDSEGNTVYDRYKYTTATTPASWEFEYELNNSSFTAAQWAAINSGATTTNIGQIATNTTTISNHIADTNNPHQVTKTQVGLGNVDNTSDANKPISTATQTALNNKANKDLDNLTNTGANIANWSHNVSNCLVEIPQDINLTLSSGTLTLKAGSKVYVPNGAGNFDVVTINSDKTSTNGWGGADVEQLVFYRRTEYDLFIFPKEFCFSGSTAPTSFLSNLRAIWYDTTNNIIKWTQDAGSTWTSEFCFPLGIIRETSGNVYSSLDQVFNGFGYIGSTVFALPGVKGLIPDGRNADGTLKNIEITISAVQTHQLLNQQYNGLILKSNGMIECAPLSNSIQWGYSYDYTNNLIKQYQSGSFVVRQGSIVGNLKNNTLKITSLTPKTVFHAVDYSDLSTVALSGAYDDLTGRPTIGNATITITQGGTTKGTFTTNQSSNTTIDLDGVAMSIDAEIVGSLTVSANGDVSGLSNANYLIFPGTIDMTNANTFEMVFAFTTSASLTSGSIINCPSITQHPVNITLSSSHIFVQVWDNSYSVNMTGTTALQTSTKYYAKLTYDGTNYTLYLSTDGVTWNNEGSMAATYLIGNIEQPYQLGRKNTGNAGLESMHLAECYIKKDNSLIWSGLGDSGLHQRAVIGHEVIEFQEPRSSNNYTWYRKYRDGWVEQGGYGEKEQTITLPVEMANANYGVLAGFCITGNDNIWYSINADSKTTTGFKIRSESSVSTNEAYWEVRGMAA